MNYRLLCHLSILFFINYGIASAQIAGTPSRSLELLPREQEIELAVSAGPEHLRKDATVFVFGKQGYEKARSGTNGFTCLVNRDGAQSGDYTLRPTCWDMEGGKSIVPVMLRVGELLAQGKTAAEIKRDVDAGFSDGRFREPRKTGIAYMLSGDVKQFDAKTGKVVSRDFPPHYMIYAPGVTNADIGMTKEGYQINPSLPGVYAGYSGGTHTAYIIVLASEYKSQMAH
ncbi:MAG TPA: hypothetical protein VM864_07910 [Pyrinomonadaceae bacterium]|jgi:hypothetical protein|nr:hypothetical protein [Pyrinomonadaceae bacterium]